MNINEYQCSVEERGSGNAVASQQNLAITIFENDTFGKIRTSGTADKPLFCLADIGRVLEMTNVNARKSKLKQDGIKEIYTLTEGGVQSLAYISEQNLYKLIMRSNKPQAEPFQDWVCGEVLPQIRKTGGYIPVSEQDDDLTVMAKALQIMQRTLEQKDRLIADKNIAIDHYSAITDKARNSSLHYNVSEVAKELGYKSAGELYRLLESKGYVLRSGRKWFPTEKFPQKFWKWSEYHITLGDGRRLDGETLHLTEAFVTAMRIKRTKSNN